ncbi:putative HTH-type transcriptional regulator [compost metagenome]
MKVENAEGQALSSSAPEDESDPGFISRLRDLASIAGSVNALARAAGISQGGLQRYLKGGEPTRKVLISLAESTGVSLQWLMTGAGSKQGDVPAPESHGLSDEYAFIPLYDARCSAGHGSWNEGCRVLTHLAFTRYSLRKKGLEAAQLSAIRVDGDSMEGLLKDGDTVLLDHRRNALEGEAVYVIRLDDHLYAKRLQRQFDGSVHIISQNKAYQVMVVPKERLGELEIIGRVVWSAGWMI